MIVGDYSARKAHLVLMPLKIDRQLLVNAASSDPPGTICYSSEVSALGVPAVLGRTFTQQEEEEGQQVAVLSYRMWQCRFHGDANVFGGQIILYRKPYTVIGVMPRDLEFPT